MAEPAAQDLNPYNQSDLPEFLNQYYKRIFPYKKYFQWLSYGEAPSKYFAHREFSFTLKDDVYLRYQSFSNQKDMEKEIQKRCPYKIDIGAVFSFKPKDNKMVKTSAFYPEEKELVFDIDMTDYDEVRTCCSGASICSRCWPFMTVAMKIVHRALREDFGFEHILWVYSGRRGVHCWVCDEAARKLSQNARSAMAEYLSVIKGGENQVKKVHFGSQLHPSLKRSMEILKKHFCPLILENQDILSRKESWKSVLALIPDEGIQKKLDDSWLKLSKTSAQRWEELVYELAEKPDKRPLLFCKEEIMFQYCYPRLDVNVTKGLNHLLKSPFCIHPKTGRVCVPIDIEAVDDFDPFTVPTISQLCREIDETSKDILSSLDENNSHITKGYESKLLDGSLRIFDRFLKKLEFERKKCVKQEKTMDW